MSGKKKEALPHVVRYLKRATDQTRLLNNFNVREFIGYRGIDLSEGDVRFIIRYIRENGLIERLVANSEGYWIEKSASRFRRYCQRLHRRGMKIVTISRVMLQQCS